MDSTCDYHRDHAAGCNEQKRGPRGVEASGERIPALGGGAFCNPDSKVDSHAVAYDVDNARQVFLLSMLNQTALGVGFTTARFKASGGVQAGKS